MRETMKVKRNSYKLFSHFYKIRRMRFAFFILLLSLEMIYPAVTFAEHIAIYIVKRRRGQRFILLGTAMRLDTILIICQWRF